MTGRTRQCLERKSVALGQRGLPLGSLLLGVLLSGVLLLGMPGCSDDHSPDGGTPVLGDYLLLGYFGGDVAAGGFALRVARLEPADASAMEAEVTLGGQDVPLRLGGTPDVAWYAILPFEYQAGEAYTILVSIGSRTASCSFTGLAYPVVTLTSPPNDHEFFPTEPIPLAWEYDEGTPARIYIQAIGDDDEVMMPPVTLSGTATSYTIPGSVTAGWGDESEILITVDEGEALFPFSGELAVEGSGVSTVGLGDAAIVTPREGLPTCTIAIALSEEEIPADGVSTLAATCTLSTAGGGDCPDGTEVTFSCTPAGAITFDPAVAIAADGLATTTVTAGTSLGAVTVRAEVPGGAYDEAALTLDQAFVFTIGSGTHPTISWSPATPMFRLMFGEAGDLYTLSTWQISATPISQITPPVTYGTVPPGTIQSIPVDGGAPEGLETGTSYRVFLIDSQEHTISYRFTHGG